MQAKAAGSRTRAGGLLCLRDFTYCGLNGTAEVRVRGAEIRKILTHLAQDNDWAVEDLLGNPDIVAGRKLPCRIVRHLPDGWSWWTGQSDYLVTKLRCSKVVAGRTFAHGLDDGDRTFSSVPPARNGELLHCHRHPHPGGRKGHRHLRSGTMHSPPAAQVAPFSVKAVYTLSRLCCIGQRT